MVKKQIKKLGKRKSQEGIEYGKSSFDSVHHGASKKVKEEFKLPKTTKIILICIALVLIVLIAYIGLNYFYTYELTLPGGTTFNPA